MSFDTLPSCILIHSLHSKVRSSGPRPCARLRLYRDKLRISEMIMARYERSYMHTGVACAYIHIFTCTIMHISKGGSTEGAGWGERERELASLPKVHNSSNFLWSLYPPGKTRKPDLKMIDQLAQKQRA